MDETSEEQRLKEEKEIRERDLRRQKEKEERTRRLSEAIAEEARKREEEEKRRIEEEERRRRQEEEWKLLGSDIIQPLPPLPAPLKDNTSDNALEAWYLDEITSRSELTTFSLKLGRRAQTPLVTLRELRELGVVQYNINLNDFSLVKQLFKERNYKHTDECRISQTNKDSNFLERWFQEHYNDDEQVRLVVDGSCYFDIRSKQDQWIRIALRAGQMIVIPAGMYHRGSLDEDDYVALFRGFRDAPRFVPIFRSDPRADSTKERINYLMKLKRGDVARELGFHEY